MLLTKPNKEGGIVHALQPQIVPEIIARVGMRWWNAGSASVAGSVVRKAVITHNIGNFGEIFDELHEAQPKSLQGLLRQLRATQGHAAKNHREKIAQGVANLFCQTADPQTNWVKETVFGVKDGAPIPSNEHPVMLELLKGPFPKGSLVPSLALMPGTLTFSDCPCRREAICTFREGQNGLYRSRGSHQ